MFFANVVFNDPYASHISQWLAVKRSILQGEIEDDLVNADTILECELLEAEEAYYNGDKEDAIKELAQCAAVIMRMIDMIKEE